MRSMLALFFVLVGSVHASPLMPDEDINDPTLSADRVMQMCQKSSMYAPDKLDAWCEKAYSMGYVDGLYYIGLQTGDGSRYIAEIKKRIKGGDHSAILSLAWLYNSGYFVKKDDYEAIRLYKLFLTKEHGKASRQISAVHYDLARLYKDREEWSKVVVHSQYVIDHHWRVGTKAQVHEWLKEAQAHLKND